ncbi:hypothetical protein BO94DRAFT_368057 [Aspergillus sclerotioniger CBS 115572]|uniref:Uncharacterized protein n=1 Tax=Aspergillus sclerotioniger CBS 115572 TaxID=1450535 RepID=A0A317X6W0_9EURO|nr:hypothetical protein BO94DRAFT_368057 [Aspergillus sclerotioniger CBS 115572]PWY93287.1 hypothetical protein BO94DRAFT_368057 [Aspergillus sclerotioniger CBS 115572]
MSTCRMSSIFFFFFHLPGNGHYGGYGVMANGSCKVAPGPPYHPSEAWCRYDARLNEPRVECREENGAVKMERAKLCTFHVPTRVGMGRLTFTACLERQSMCQTRPFTHARPG